MSDNPEREMDEEVVCDTEAHHEVMHEAKAESHDHAMAVKPFLATVSVAPTNAPRIDRSAPKESLELDYIYGYRCHDSRTNVAVNSKGHIVYPAAAIVVTMDPATRAQKFAHHHDGSIVCLARHPKNPDIVATGQVAYLAGGKGQPPSVAVYNSITQEKWVIKNAGDRAIRAIAFSPSGDLIATAASDDKFTITVYEWASGKKIATSPSAAKSAICALAWNPGNEKEFVSVGANHVTFWTLEAGSLKGKSRLDAVVQGHSYFCAAYNANGSECLIGGQDGSVHVFSGGGAAHSSKAHKLFAKKIHSIAEHGGAWAIGGDDKIVGVFDKSLKKVWEANLDYQVRSLTSVRGQDLVVGTRGSELFLIPAAAQKNAPGSAPAPLMRGHFDGEVWGIVPHPKSSQFASVGEDNQIVTWDADKHSFVSVGQINATKGRFVKVNKAGTTSNFPVNQMARAIDYSPDGSLVAVGTNEGTVHVCDANSLKVVHTVDLNKFGKRKIDEQSQNWVEAIRFSPSGDTLAVGTHGICIVLLSTRNKFACEHIIHDHTAAPIALDWSADGAFLRSVSLSYELLFHKVDEKNLKATKHETSAHVVRDTVWRTETVKFAWDVMGIWQKDDKTEEVDFSHINGVDVNAKRTLVATGNDNGSVNLFRYPAAKEFPTDKPDNGFKTAKGHSSHVPRVRFDYGGRYLFSAGGEDKCIFQWKFV